ncbi:hypothetical protein K431DRAFT_282737 [Polychaeton citri CBS 116435]|uniref:Uncharacterized protein n=1 Tax=Polychaeton citri CBS 116435 TaxID=1314669 RepID=A0A9P4QEX8_9PEZI|nr:hypothetical protein K431DRAFT_282737 [Polychaeton citri CBS 116435]
MTASSPATQMYIHGAVRFRDPFSKDSLPGRQPLDSHSRGSWEAQTRFSDINRVLTPPPEMNGPTNAYRPIYHQQENGFPNANLAASRYGPNHAQTYSPAATHKANALTNPQNAVTTTHSGSRPASPAQARGQSKTSQSRRGSHQNNIAVQYQIPRSINDSGGSISELAAQITCLFWFESSDLLQQIEDGPMPTHPMRPLVPDAKPSTGFRKWVTTMISTTLVGTNVVLLALLFIRRLKKLNPGVKGKPGSEFRLLTVALMLGNKFLDDNTYTNKTWAEVSGINVAEVHIMEVEFLSNMKYCLYTSAKEWSEWMGLLGRYADFIERASRPLPAPILPPASSLHLPMALPSPPASLASPPELSGPVSKVSSNAASIVLGPTPTPSPMAVMPNWQASQPNPRKRSLDDQSCEPAAKRVASSQTQHSSQVISHRMQPIPRLPLPSLSIPMGQSPSTTSQPTQATPQTQQLPPLHAPNRSMGLVFPTASQNQQAHVDALSMPPSQIHSQQHSRQQSPFPNSANVSPTGNAPRSAGLPLPATQISPSYYLQQRNSPYRPVHNVSTLLYPPPSAALQQRPQNLELNRMHYQPLGRPAQLQTGRLPHVPHSLWAQGMTPTSQWQGFPSGHQQQQQQQQQKQQQQQQQQQHSLPHSKA